MSGQIERVCVFGAGAVGGHMAARLARAGLDVSVVARGTHLDAIRRNGLTLIGTDERFTVRVAASESAADLGPQDLVITAVKAHGLPAAAPQIRELLRGDTPVVFAVNGIPWWYFHGLAADAQTRLPRLDPTGALWQHIGANRALGCVIRSPNEIIEPGVILSSSPTSKFSIGEPSGPVSARVEAVVGALARGLPGAQVVPDIRAEIWGKLMVNLPSSLLSTLTTSTSPDLFANPETRELYRRVAEEGKAVAASHGVDVAFDFDAQVKWAGQNRHPPSMLQDLLAGRPLELDAQLRAVQDLARQSGVATPLVDVMIALLAQRAAARDFPIKA